jgi:hypothetical protein
MVTLQVQTSYLQLHVYSVIIFALVSTCCESCVGGCLLLKVSSYVLPVEEVLLCCDFLSFGFDNFIVSFRECFVLSC